MTMSAWRVKAGLSLLTCFYGVCDLPFPCASPQETSNTLLPRPFLNLGAIPQLLTAVMWAIIN